MSKKHPTHYKTTEVDKLEIFYREAGDKNAPVILLLHAMKQDHHLNAEWTTAHHRPSVFRAKLADYEDSLPGSGCETPISEHLWSAYRRGARSKPRTAENRRPTYPKCP